MVHREALVAPIDAFSREGTLTVTPETITEVGPVESLSAVDTGPAPQQELPVVRDEENVPAAETDPVQEGARIVLLQTTGGFNLYEGQVEVPSDNRELSNVSSAPEVGGSEQEESAGDKDLPSVDSMEGQDSDLERGDVPIETGTPQKESVHESTRDSSSREGEAREDQSPGRDVTEGGDNGQGWEEPPDRETDGDDDGHAGDGNEGDNDGPGNGGDQGDGRQQETDDPDAEDENEENEPEDPDRQEGGAASGQPGLAGGKPAQGTPALPIRIVTRQAQAQM